MGCWNEAIEKMGREELYELQTKRLKETVSRVYNNVPFYKAKFDEMGIKPEDIRSPEDLPKLPFTLKQDFRDNYPYGLIATDLDNVVRIHASSGTTGKQTVVGYTRNDIDIWSECMARTIAGAGGTKSDKVHVSYGYGLFTGGLGAHYGAEYMGALTIPASTGNTQRQIQMLCDFGATMICCTPSYALHLAEAMIDAGIDPKTIPLRAGCFGAEPWTESMRREIEQKLAIKAYDVFGMSELIGPGVSYECECQSGLHINEDYFLAEIIDEKTGEVLPDGEFGELVFTCVGKEALPLIRYRTRDIARIIPDECGCGRVFRRMSKPTGRTDDMLIIRGVNVFPSQIESVLLEIAGTAPYYLLVVDRVNNLDTLEIVVEMSEEYFSDSVRVISELEEQIRNAVQSVTGISAKIRLADPRTITRSEGKAKRILDKREIQ